MRWWGGWSESGRRRGRCERGEIEGVVCHISTAWKFESPVGLLC